MGKRGALPSVLHMPAGLAPMPPEKPLNLPQDVSDAWDWIVAECSSRNTLTTGDAMIVEACARLWARFMSIEAALEADPLDEQLNRLLLAVMRQWGVMSGKLGLNPMDRNRLLSVHVTEEKSHVDELLG